MSKPHKCPVCDGTGKIARYDLMGTTGAPDLAVCNACNSTGIVWEPETPQPLSPAAYVAGYVSPPTS